MPIKRVWRQRRHPTTQRHHPTTTTSLVASVRATPASHPTTTTSLVASVRAFQASLLERCSSPEWTTSKKTPSSATMDDDADEHPYVMKTTPTPTRKSARKNNHKANKVVPPSEATMSQNMAEDADVGDDDGDKNGGVTGDGGATGDGGVDGKKDVDNNNDIINTDNSSPTNTTAATTSPTSKIQTVSNLCMYVIGAYLTI